MAGNIKIFHSCIFTSFQMWGHSETIDRQDLFEFRCALTGLNGIMDSIAILDFGSQYAQIIARRVREAQVYCELFPWDAPMEQILAIQPKGFILSGGPKSVYEPGAPYIQEFIFKTGLPILGICYGMQALTHALGGRVDSSAQREYGFAEIEPTISNSLVSNLSRVWMSHGDRITRLPDGFIALARSGNSPFAAMGDMKRKYFGVQFHPEVHHTPNGEKLLKHFAVDICGAKPTWTPASIIEESVERVQKQVGRERVLAAVSGGVDSSVAAALVRSSAHRISCLPSSRSVRRRS